MECAEHGDRVAGGHDDECSADSEDSDDSTTTSSTENLTGEQRFVLRHMRRQEPQGQERQSADGGGTPSPQVSLQQLRHVDGSHCSRLETASSCRTLIIHGSLSEDSWPRIAGTGSIQDLGPLGGSGLYLTSTPNGKCQQQQQQQQHVSMAGASAGSIQRHHLLCSSPSLIQSAKSLTRSLPRSVKDFSALGFYQPQLHDGGSAGDLLPADVVDCEQPHERQLKILERLAREMNLKLPGEQTFHSYAPPDASLSGMQSPGGAAAAATSDEGCGGDDDWSRLSISDTLLTEAIRADEGSATTLQSPAAKCCRADEASGYAKDFSYLSKPPPAYPRRTGRECSNSPSTASNASESGATIRRSKVRRALSRSHPDLSKLGKELGLGRQSHAGGDATRTQGSGCVWKGLRQRCESVLRLQVDRSDPVAGRAAEPSAKGPPSRAPAAAVESSGRPQDPEAVWSTPELVDAIMEENFALRQQVQSHQANVAKLHKFEQELSAVHSAHEALVRSCERKESLERSARLRLEAELRRSQDVNAGLRGQVEALANQLALVSGRSSVASSAASCDSHQAANGWHKEVARRDALIAQLISQNKELLSHKERQEVEVCAQRATLQQQRSHIDILQSALTNAQLHIASLEDQCRRSKGQPDGGSGQSAEAAGASHRELANMEIRIRDLEAKLNEKETLICLLQRRSMDRELVYGSAATGRLPESVSLLNRHPSGASAAACLPSHPQQTAPPDANPPPPAFKGAPSRGSCSTSGVCSSPGSSLPGSSRGSAASVASSGGVAPTQRHQLKAALQPPTVESPAAHQRHWQQQPNNNHNNNNSQAETAQSLDNQLRALDRFYQNKQSLIQALQSDKERFPNYYWPS